VRVVITGATGNVGTSVIRSLASESVVDEVVGLARRVPHINLEKTTWRSVDVSRDDLGQHFRGADVVIHLAWLIQPSRDEATLYATNVTGSRRVFRAVADANVRSLVYASSIGAYSPGPKETQVDESWPTNGIDSSFYARHKGEVERILDTLEEERPDLRTVRLRPGLIFKKEAATGIRRLFFGPLLPHFLVRQRLIPVVPDMKRLRFQCLHSYDAGEAYRLAAISEVRGPFNIAAEPILDASELADLLNARSVRISERAVRLAVDVTWRARLQPTPVGWVDLAFETPIMDTSRAKKELGWEPRLTSRQALLDLLAGLKEGASFDTPPLARGTTAPVRIKEFLTGIGKR
jgi:UDP-glucose 4-epimerase